MKKPETYSFGLLPEAQRRTGMFRFTVDLLEEEVESMRVFIKDNGPEASLKDLKSYNECLYALVLEALHEVAGETESEVLWPDEIVMDYYPEYFD